MLSPSASVQAPQSTGHSVYAAVRTAGMTDVHLALCPAHSVGSRRHPAETTLGRKKHEKMVTNQLQRNSTRDMACGFHNADQRFTIGRCYVLPCIDAFVGYQKKYRYNAIFQRLFSFVNFRDNLGGMYIEGKKNYFGDKSRFTRCTRHYVHAQQ